MYQGAASVNQADTGVRDGLVSKEGDEEWKRHQRLHDSLHDSMQCPRVSAGSSWLK
jgi:hypothetical protein